MRHVFVSGFLAACMVVSGCATERTTAGWRRKASAIPVGTARHEVERALPSSGVVLDLRSGKNSAGPVAYWVDDTTLVKLWYDEQSRLGKPVIVEQKKRPEANKTDAADS